MLRPWARNGKRPILSSRPSALASRSVRPTLAISGFVKLIGDAGTGQLLGAHIIGAKASEIIHECALAIAADLDVEHLARAIHAHPTVSESVGEAAEDAEGVAIHLMRQEAKAAAR